MHFVWFCLCLGVKYARLWLTTVLVGLVTFHLCRRYIKHRGMPPGPTAYPIMGSLLDFVTSRSLHEIMVSYRARFGKIFTIWLSNVPAVVIYDWNLCKEANAVSVTDFMGRPDMPLVDYMLRNDSDIILRDYNHRWETLRKAGHTALRRFTNSSEFPLKLQQSVDNVIEKMLSEEKAFDPSEHLYLLFFNVVSGAAHGRSYEETDFEFRILRRFNQVFYKMSGGTMIMNFAPILTPFFKTEEQVIKDVTDDIKRVLKDNLQHHTETFLEGKSRDITDSLIESKENAERRNMASKEHLTLDNIKLVIADLFIGGVDTTHTSLRWMMLVLASYPEIQQKIYDEVDQNIGDRVATQADKRKCPYISAFLAESFRFRTLSPFGIPRKAICHTTLGGYKIPRGTLILFYLKGLHQDPKVWSEPDNFIPERFLDSDGNFISSGMSHYSPFGFGRRACIGEKLALFSLFLSVVRIVQRCSIELEGGPNSADLRPLNKALFNLPQPYFIKLKERI